MNNSRREFLSSLLAVGAGVGLVTVIGCGDDDPVTDSGTPTDTGTGGDTGMTGDSGMTGDTGTAGDSGMTGDTGMETDSMMASSCDSWTAEIGTNHSHAMTVSAADVTAGVDKTYDIQGGSAHPHSVMITAANFADLAAGTTVTATSSNDNGHTHAITVTCAGA